MRARSCLKVFLVSVALLQPCFAEVCDDGMCAYEESPDDLVALQKPSHSKKKGGARASPKSKKQAHSLVGGKGERVKDYEIYEGTTESSYENVLAKLGTSLGKEKCAVPQSLKYRWKSSRTLGFASKGAQSITEMMDAPPLRKPFTYIRFGDAEWACALGTGSGAAKDNKTSADICDKLLEDLQDFGSRPSAKNRDAWNLFVGVGAGYLCKETNPKLHSDVDDFLRKKEKNVQDKFNGWLDSFYLPLVPSKETAGVFMDRAAPLLNGRKVVTVGPEHILDLERLTHRVDHIAMHSDPLKRKISSHKFWAAQREVYDKILSASHAHPNDNVVFLVAGGIPAKLLMYKAYRTIGHKDTIIDLGASLDIFTGNGQQEWNKDTGKICRDYPHYVEGKVCVEAASRHMKMEAKEDKAHHRHGKN